MAETSQQTTGQDTTRQKAEEYRAEAARARRLAAGLAVADAQRLLDYAEDLETRALAAEAEGASGTGR